MATADRTAERQALRVARRHVGVLALIALASISSALPIWRVALGPDGRDPFYVALAIQFAVWGVIDLLFVLNGVRSLVRPSADEVTAMRTRTLKALRISGWLNLLYLAIGLAIVAAGYRVWSATLVGHGVGVLLQAIPLTLLDLSFARGLRRIGR